MKHDRKIFCISNPGQMRQTYRVKAMAALISPQVISTGDQGSIIIGGSYAHLAHDQGYGVISLFRLCSMF